jgi:hypothetical protein
MKGNTMGMPHYIAYTNPTIHVGTNKLTDIEKFILRRALVDYFVTLSSVIRFASVDASDPRDRLTLMQKRQLLVAVLDAIDGDQLMEYNTSSSVGIRIENRWLHPDHVAVVRAALAAYDREMKLPISEAMVVADLIKLWPETTF